MFKDAEAASIWLGVASLFVSVLNTVNSYYRWAARAEGHRVNALHYGKLYRYIAVQMGLPQHERIRAADFLNMVKEQYDRLQEVAPPIPTEVVKEFKATFASDTYKGVARPEELNGLEKIKVNTTGTIKKSPSFFTVEIDGGKPSSHTSRGEATNKRREGKDQKEDLLPAAQSRNPSEENASVLGKEGAADQSGGAASPSGSAS
jgi:hypothetical protein